MFAVQLTYVTNKLLERMRGIFWHLQTTIYKLQDPCKAGARFV
jgi:hypothetical protein